MTTEKMEIRVDLFTLQAMMNHNTDFITEIKEVWWDFGGNIRHTTLVAVDRKSTELSMKFQMLTGIEAGRATNGTMTLIEAVGVVNKYRDRE